MGNRTYVRWGSLLLLIAAVTSVAGWFALGPDTRVAVHFGLEGADRWAGRTEAAIGIPLVMVGIFLLGWAEGRQRVRRGKEPWTNTVLIASLALLTVLHGLVLGLPTVADDAITSVVGVGSGLVLLVVGVVLRRRGDRSVLAGVRVPGTAHDEVAGRAADRVASTGLLVLGGTLVVLGLLLPLWGVVVVITGGLVTIGLLAVRAAGRSRGRTAAPR